MTCKVSIGNLYCCRKHLARAVQRYFLWQLGRNASASLVVKTQCLSKAFVGMSTPALPGLEGATAVAHHLDGIGRLLGQTLEKIPFFPYLGQSSAFECGE
jgi:hypothetical protein